MVNIKIRLIIFHVAKDGEALYSQQKKELEMTGSDNELLTTKMRLKLKKIGKTTRPFMYDLSQILYDYTVEMMNRFKGLDLADRVPEDLWTKAHNTVQDTVTKTIPKKKKCKKPQRLSEEALQIAEERRDVKGKGEKKIYRSEFRVPKKSKER